MRTAFAPLAVLLALAVSPVLAPGWAPAAAAQVAVDSQASPATVAPAPAQAAATPSGLPRRAPVARTMEAYWPVFAFFAVTWVGIVAYLLVAGRRSGRLTRRLHEMEELP